MKSAAVLGAGAWLLGPLYLAQALPAFSNPFVPATSALLSPEMLLPGSRVSMHTALSVAARRGSFDQCLFFSWYYGYREKICGIGVE